jgi:hypothetical protein
MRAMRLALDSLDLIITSKTSAQLTGLNFPREKQKHSRLSTE